MKAFDQGSDEEMTRDHAAVFAALYLRGVFRAVSPSSRRWPQVLHALRVGELALREAAQGLSAAGFDEEAYVLGDEALVERAVGWVLGRCVLTAACPAYPARWIERLHHAAPPALWWNGVAFSDAPGLSAVGSREIGAPLGRAMAELGAEAAERDYLVVSGGAAGCDRAAVRGALAWWGSSGAAAWPCEFFEGEKSSVAAPAVEILPYGLEHAAARQGRLRVAQLSVCEPWAEFTSAQAMERNALIYAWSAATLVGHARLREGGTWAGAADCLRRRLSKLLVLSPVPGVKEAPGNAALIALGGVPLSGPGGLGEALAAKPIQPAFDWDEPYPQTMESPRAAKRLGKVSEVVACYAA